MYCLSVVDVLIWFDFIGTCIGIQWKVFFFARYTHKIHCSRSTQGKRIRCRTECCIYIVGEAKDQLSVWDHSKVRWQQGRSCSWVGWYVSSDFWIFSWQKKVEEKMSRVHWVLNYAGCFSEAAGSVDSVNGWKAGLRDGLGFVCRFLWS